MLETINTLSVVVGLILTAIGLAAIAYQLILTRRLARNDFMLRLYEHIQEHNAIHLRLADWTKSSKGPESPEEWNKVRRYMGLLEALEQLIVDGVYPKERADRDYSHRILAIVTNPVICKQSFGEDRLAWLDFIDLWSRLESCAVYRALAEEYVRNGVSVPKADSAKAG